MTKREIKISLEFKAQIVPTNVNYIFHFDISLMLVLAVGLTALCIYGGIMLIAIRPMFITVALGNGD